MTGSLARLDGWREGFLRDPAGFIDGLAEPWRAIGLLELAAGAWASSPFHAAFRPNWRLAYVEGGPSLVAAFAAGGDFLAAAEASPDRPGLLRLRGAPARVEVYACGGMKAGPVRLAPWNGWTAFGAARRAGAPWVEALQAAWPPSGPRLLPGGAEPFAPPADEAYAAWTAANPPSPSIPAEGPRFVVETDTAGAAALADQTWPHWRLASAGLARPGEASLTLAPGDRLAPEALAVLAAAFADPAVTAVYADEERIDAAGTRTSPVFKTGFDAERLKRQDYIGAACARRAGAAGGQARHVPQVLWRRASAPTWPIAPEPAAPDVLPRVRIVVPTRDRPDLLRACAAGILERTAYPDLELVIVDNGSVEAETRALLDGLAKRPRVRVMRIDGPFDYPALNNAAAAETEAGLLAFVNDDVWVIEPDWLTRMAALAVLPEVGAVGAKLFYPDGRIQHAGVTLGLGALGVAGHGFRGAPSDFEGPQQMLKVVRQVSAVTGACVMVGREKFEAVGGFDPAFKVAFNDVDLCLRLAGRGWKTLWTPHARLVHLESASRGRGPSPERAALLTAEAEAMHARWGPLLTSDPYYHPALSLTGERFALGERLRSVEPR